ncbi:MAG: hypothetical protein ACK5MQ_00960 [Pikeienuella sp.]
MKIADQIAGIAGLYRLGEHAGIFAALLALPLAWALHWLGGFPLLAAATLIGAAKVWWAAPRTGVPVIADRMVGQWLALWTLSLGLWLMGAAPAVFPWPGWVGGFLLCQLLIVVFDRAGFFRALNPVWDDLAAGLATSLLAVIAAGLSHGWF